MSQALHPIEHLPRPTSARPSAWTRGRALASHAETAGTGFLIGTFGLVVVTYLATLALAYMTR